MKIKCKKNRKGSVLIFSLWALAFLSIFAVQIGMRIRQRASLLARLEERSQLRHAAEAGIKKAISALKKDSMRHQDDPSFYNKRYLNNNEDFFKNIVVGSASAEIYYTTNEGPMGTPLKYYGMVDEGSKLNIKTASQQELTMLIQNVANLTDADARSLALAIVGWRLG